MATAKLIHAEYLAMSTGPGWARLTALGATPQRLLWSGPAVPDGRQPDLRYVQDLVGRDTAALLTPHTAVAFLADGRVRPTLDLWLPTARRILAAHVKAGISPRQIVTALEAENVRRGAEAFGQVRALIDDKLMLLGAAVGR